MIRAVTEYLRECGRLLKWVFFQPSKLSPYLRGSIIEVSDYWFLKGLWEPTLFKLLSKGFTIISTLSFAVVFIISLAARHFDGSFNWSRSLSYLAGSLLVSIILFLIINSIFGIPEGFALGIAYCLLLAIIGGCVGGKAAGVATGTGVGLAVGIIASVSAGIELSIFGGVLMGLAFGLGVPAASGNLIGGIAGSIAGLAGALRLIFYFFEIGPALIAYRKCLKSSQPERELLSTPIFFDEMLVWPQPYLSSFLLQIYEKNPHTGLHQIGRVACMPFQRWAAQKAFRTLLEDRQSPFFFNLHLLLTSPEPFTQSGFDISKHHWENNPYFSTQVLLAELMTSWPKSPWWYDQSQLNDWQSRTMTFWLRRHGQSPYSEIAKAYFELLYEAPELLGKISRPGDDGAAKLSDNDSALVINRAINAISNHSELPYAKEFYELFRLTRKGLVCESLLQIASMRGDFKVLFEIAQPLRPQIVSVFRRLRDAAQDATAFLTAEHELTQRGALLKAGDVLEEARQLANEVYEPERSLLLAVIEHWRRMFAIEGGRVAEQREVEVLPNPYVAGRPIRPEDGQLFVGRKDEFRAIEEKLQTGVGVVIWGQRRIGKTSMLLHLPGHLSHDLLPVYLNLQMLMANTTGGFLYAVAREIVKQMSGRLRGAEPRGTEQGAVATGSASAGIQTESTVATAAGIPSETTGSLPLPVPYLPSAEEFIREPYLSFNHLLENIERQLQPGQRVLLSFDEFEELEQRVKSGKIEPEIFAYLRGVTQTGRGFALLFAGLHTLEQMTREYWNPFFASVQTLKVGYLSELDAEQLITDPIEQFPLSYEYEAIKRITDLTRSHAYLTQSLCHNLVNRLNDPLYRSQKARREDVDAVVEKTLESSGYYFDDFVWGWSSAEERIALSLLAEKLAEVEGDAAFSVVEKHLGREAALTATRNLVARDILSERTGETGELVFRFQIPLAQMWVKQKKPSARILMEGGRL